MNESYHSELKNIDFLEKSTNRDRPINPNYEDNNNDRLIDVKFSDLKDSPLNLANKTSETILIPILKKFIYLLKKATNFYKVRFLNENILYFIDDISHFSRKTAFLKKNVIIFNSKIFFSFIIDKN